MLRKFAQTAGTASLALCAAGVGYFLLRHLFVPRASGARVARAVPRMRLATGRARPPARAVPPHRLPVPTGPGRSLLLRAARALLPARRTYFLSRWAFLRVLGLVFLAAFLSLRVQIKGLAGRRGILPIGEYLDDVRERKGLERYFQVPTLCWLDASDRGLDRLCDAGMLLSGLLILGVAPAPTLIFLVALYLSLVVAGGPFLGYQWDSLLLETGLHAVLLTPPQLWPRLGQEPPPPRSALWLLRWLLFRVMFSSGAVKLTSGDPTWRNHTAMRHHYLTQPLPAWTSWYLHKLPARMHRLSSIFALAVELLLPPLFFGPRRGRQFAAAGTVLLQALIAASGNFGFFNLLTASLCLPLLDDDSFPRSWQEQTRPSSDLDNPPGGWPAWLLLPCAAAILAGTAAEFLDTCELDVPWLDQLRRLRRWHAPFRFFNSYGLFAEMTTTRPEIIVQGSNDGRSWLPYEFKWKPGAVKRRPRFTGLHMPRLDWQMWFAALEPRWERPWVIRFLRRLLEGSPEVLALLERSPFPEPPRYVRALLYDYHFSTEEAWRRTGAWWRRRRLGPYCPVLTLEEGEERWEEAKPRRRK